MIENVMNIMAACSRQQRQKKGIWKWALENHVFAWLAGL
jgi:hypothetical protein